MKFLTAALIVFSAPAWAAPGMSDAKSATNAIFQDIQQEARDVLNHADQLQSFADRTHLGWDTQSLELGAIKDDVNHIEAQLTRLQALRPGDAPWQQAEIKSLAATARLLVDNTQDAILFGDQHPSDLWLGPYRMYANNLYNEARTLNQTLDHAYDRL